MYINADFYYSQKGRLIDDLPVDRLLRPDAWRAPIASLTPMTNSTSFFLPCLKLDSSEDSASLDTAFFFLSFLVSSLSLKDSITLSVTSLTVS